MLVFDRKCIKVLNIISYKTTRKYFLFLIKLFEHFWRKIGKLTLGGKCKDDNQ